VCPTQLAYWNARLLTAQGKLNEALSALKPLMPVKQDAVGFRLLAAKLAMFADQPGDALSYLGPDQTAEPLAITLLRAEIRRRTGQHEDAIRSLENLVDRQPKAVDGWLLLGRLQRESDSVDQSLAVIRRGRVANPQNAQLEDRLLTLLLESRQPVAAEELAETVFRQSSTAETCLRLAIAFQQAGELDHADRWLGRVRRLDDGNLITSLPLIEAAFLQERGVATSQRSLLEESKQQYERILKRSPGHISAMNNLAWLLLRHLDQPAGAATLVSTLRTKVSARNTSPAVMDTIAETLRATGRSDEALKLVTDSLLRHPDEAILRFHYGVLLMEQADDDSQRKQGRRELERARLIGGLSKERRTELTQRLNSEKPQALTPRAG
jgi:predicted Zn-dependent protease